jgi:CubicO group peptidase (beta-lactamase class C family)
MKRAVIRRKLARVDRALDKAIDRAEIPGAVVLAQMLIQGEMVEHLSVRGLAVLRPERIPMTRETVFDLASLTKPMVTTTSILLLAAEDALQLDDPVTKWLPVFAERDKEAVTLRHLLTHSSGLKPWRGFHEPLLERERKTGERLVGTREGRDWILDRVLRSGLVHDPGEAAVYGDLDFMALGAVVEAVTRQSLDGFFAERVARPLGLESTSFLPVPAGRATPTGEGAVSDALRRRIAATENCAWRDRILWGEVHDPNASAMGGVAGHAGLFSTADDIMRFAQAWVDAWHEREGLLPARWVREFCRRQRLPEKSDWALGWDTPTAGASSSGSLFSQNSIGHLGFTGTSLWIDLEQRAVVVMLTNRLHLVAKRSRFDLRPVIHDHILDAFLSG